MNILEEQLRQMVNGLELENHQLREMVLELNQENRKLREENDQFAAKYQSALHKVKIEE